MGPGVGLPFIAEGILTAGMAVIHGTAYPQVIVTSGANVSVLGFVINDAISGQEVAIHPVTNGAAKCKAIAGANIARGDRLMAEGADGRLKTLVADNTDQFGCGIALEAASDGQLFDILPCFWESFTALT
jgi:hypothetical protein